MVQRTDSIGLNILCACMGGVLTLLRMRVGRKVFSHAAVTAIPINIGTKRKQVPSNERLLFAFAPGETRNCVKRIRAPIQVAPGV